MGLLRFQNIKWYKSVVFLCSMHFFTMYLDVVLVTVNKKVKRILIVLNIMVADSIRNGSIYKLNTSNTDETFKGTKFAKCS